ncbi:VanZ family protein [Sporosarcina siberiensis]|uniref:VanZ family protein n=1 Tax=Sporosarcina siberiensis TaxID=1365606 RepID=A0ABW4SBD8_9BACL
MLKWIQLKGCHVLFVTRLCTFLYMLIILVAICNADPHAFLYEQVVSFNINPTPAFTDLFLVEGIYVTSSFYLVQKIGHFSVFGLLYIFLLRSFNNVKTALLVSITFAFVTEIAQLYFNRTGRLVDVAIDLIGIFLAYYLSKKLVGTPKLEKEELFS